MPTSQSKPQKSSTNTKIEVERMWELKTTTVPVVMGALCTIKKGMESYINKSLATPTPENNSAFYCPPT